MPAPVPPLPSPTPTAVEDTPTEQPVSGPGHRLRLTLLMAGSCLPILGAVLIAPVLPQMQAHFADVPGVDALVPMALTIPALSLALLAPFAGVIVDRLGRKRLLVVSTVLYAILGTAPLWLDSLGAIVASRALVGVAEAAIMTCSTTLIGDYYSGRQRDRYLAMQTMCASISATAFFVLGGAAGSAGWRMPFWAYAVSLVLAPAMAAFLPRPRPTDRANEPSPTASELTEQAIKRPFPWRPLAGTCALTVFGAILFYTVQVEMAFLLDDMGVSNSGVIGLATAGSSAAVVVGAVVFAKAGRSPQVWLPTAFGLCTLGFAVIWLAPNPVVLTVGAVINCLGSGIMLPSLLTLAMSKLDYADRGRGTGLWTGSFFLGQFICPLAVLALTSAVGTLANALGVLALAGTVATTALGLTARRRRTGATPAPIRQVAG
ncbi:MFS transporter [Streptomyces griseorubiginosus]|uniref:MFS transporter n=1 Tax=Streptomyces griseorubiginosus TaxID=67304 RepID=UPI002E7FF1E1|nr:MFS transporter [Streptomyces griseorubiginosus]WUB41920.1 MFS transporter [Streptomyces griseorubiginosus]WUB50440.1 MFS transporter [Streptomyces griseorubiginosus]